MTGMVILGENYQVMSKPLSIILLSLLVGAVLFVALLYYTLKTKITDVSDKKPYSEVLNKELVLQRDAIIAKSRSADTYANPYLLTEQEDQLMSEAVPRYRLAKGTAIRMTAAKLFKNGTSGFTHAYVLGKIYVPEIKLEVEFEYQWGESHISIYNDFKDYWTFPQAIWQESSIFDGEKFYF